MTADLLYWIVLFLILVIGFLILRFCKEKSRNCASYRTCHEA